MTALDRLNHLYPIRYTVFGLAAAGAVLSLITWLTAGTGGWLFVVCALLTALGVYDMRMATKPVLRNYPIVGHFRFLLESIRPQIRQYFIEGENDAVPFSHAQRHLVAARAANAMGNRPFGTTQDVSAEGYEWINHSLMPTRLPSHDFRITVGGPVPGRTASITDCTQPYSLSVFNISAMSFGALSANAILALNAGAKRGGFAHDTGEGSISQYHRVHGGDLIWEIGSGYFGCRNDDGTFSEARFTETANSAQVKMIEIKLSQGAKPGHGGVLPAAKVSPEIAAARGVPVGVECVSPSSHSAFRTPLEMMHFIARLRQLSGGKPVGFKLCIGHPWEWFGLVKAMLETDITPDFIVVDGGEGGTGAAPLEFCDHVGTPLQEGLLLVHNTLVGVNLRHRIQVGCSGKIISAFDIAQAMALGADWCNSARGFMFALGCIQSQNCHNDTCPTGVATQDKLRQKALVVTDKAEAVYHFHRHTLEAFKDLVQAAGLNHPNELTADHIVRRLGENDVRQLSSLIPQVCTGGILADGSTGVPVLDNYWQRARADSFALAPQDTALVNQRPVIAIHPVN